MCLHPQLIRIDSNTKYNYFQVPCRKCVECLKQQQNDWMIRMVEEFRNFDKVLFITLTYREETIPKIFNRDGEFRYSVCKKHIQDWLKRYRIREQRAGHIENWRYFVASEYSPRADHHWRAHYHLIIFGKSATRFWSALRDWKDNFGFFKYDLVGSSENIRKNTAINVSRYVSKYCLKGVFDKPVWEFGDEKHHPEKTFRLVSKHFGESYVDRMRDFHTGKLYNSVFPAVKEYVDDYPIYSEQFLDYVVRNRVVCLPGSSYTYHMPRYYADKIFKETRILFPKVVGDYGPMVPSSPPVCVVCPTPLSEQVSDFILETHMRDTDSKLQQLLSDHPGWTYFEAYRALECEEVSSIHERERAANKALVSFYRKAKL